MVSNCRCYVVGARSERGARRLGGNPDKQPPEGWNSADPDTGAPPGIDPGWDYMPGRRARALGEIARRLAPLDPGLRDMAVAMADKTRQWPYELAKAYMQALPARVRDAHAIAYRGLPSVAEDTRRYAQAVLAGRPVPPYRTLGLLTASEARQIAGMTGQDAGRLALYDWAIDRNAPGHVRRQHGDAATEAPRGQVAVTVEDYARLPAIILDADALEYGGTSDVGRPVVRARRRWNDVEYTAAFELRSSRRMMVLQTLWKSAQSPGLRP
ncbi:hypothetical protein [Thiohalobacter sp.]|uniref:PBECR3 domain-containing polyvalent protein n=1 Tax=Thiohalobacter sp. TaxID=2025948 RepID=UPI002630DAA2|nr:hypothetical protein [Thiohalobacter sp.]